jgi:1-acyl-sn-glycerol-3-phosphate acyltransferase
MIRTLVMLGFWAALLPFAALIGFPWTLLTGDVSLLYRMTMWGAWNGVRLAGIQVKTVGLDKLDPARTYIFMSNHVSNVDPPILMPLIPRRMSIMVKKELFRVPVLARLMRFGSLVPVDRGNRESGIAAVRAAAEVIRQGVNMTIYVEGHRSFDGKLLPFKKGPFYLAEECGVPVVPVTIVGSHEVMPKRRFAIKPGTVTVIFHAPIEPKDFGSRDCLMAKVRRAIDSGLAVELQESNPTTTEDTKVHEGKASA